MNKDELNEAIVLGIKAIEYNISGSETMTKEQLQEAIAAVEEAAKTKQPDQSEQ